MKRKILHVFGRMQRGGAEVMLLRIMRQLSEQFHFHFCALSGLPGELDAEIRALGGEVHYLPLNRRFIGDFGRLLETERFDGVHSHVHHFSGAILALAAWKRVPLRIAHFHSVYSMVDSQHESLQKKVQNWTMRLLLDRVGTDLIAVCDGVRSTVWPRTRLLRSPCRVIYNGVRTEPVDRQRSANEVRQEFAISASAPLLIHVGSFSAAKNHLRLLDIFSALVTIRPGSQLLLIGRESEPLRQQILDRLASRQLRGQVRLLGERHDVPRLLAAADLMIFPSLWEGLPVAVLEACAAGTPVVASALPGIAEVAARLSSRITCVPLGANDVVWASEIAAVLDRRVSTDDLMDALAQMRNTPFAFEEQVRSLCSIWSRQS